MKKRLFLLSLFIVCCTCLFSCTTENNLFTLPQTRYAGWYSYYYTPYLISYTSAEDMLFTIRTKNYQDHLPSEGDFDYERTLSDAAYMHMISTLWGIGCVYYADEPEATYDLCPMREANPIYVQSAFKRNGGRINIRLRYIVKDPFIVNVYNKKDGQLIETTDQHGAEYVGLFYEGIPTQIDSKYKDYYFVRNGGAYILEFKVASTEELTADQVIDLLHSVNIQKVNLWDEIKPY